MIGISHSIWGGCECEFQMNFPYKLPERENNPPALKCMSKARGLIGAQDTILCSPQEVKYQSWRHSHRWLWKESVRENWSSSWSWIKFLCRQSKTNPSWITSFVGLAFIFLHQFEWFYFLATTYPSQCLQMSILLLTHSHADTGGRTHSLTHSHSLTGGRTYGEVLN